MDTRNARSRKAIEILSQAINEPTLKDLYAMLLSVIQSRGGSSRRAAALPEKCKAKDSAKRPNSP